MIRSAWVSRIADVFKGSRLSQNTGQKIISLLFAILFWLYVMDQVNPEMIKELENIKVELLNMPSVTQSGLVIMNEEEYFVNVTVKGRRNDLFDVTNEDIRVTADLTGYGKGDVSVPLETRTFNGSFIVDDLSQKEIKLFLDKVVEISKPVNLDVVGETKNGYVKGELEYEPQEISVRGPESFVNTVAMIYGEMKIDGTTNDLSKEIPVKPVDNDGNVVGGVTLGRDYIRASIGVSKLKTLSLNERITGQAASGYEIVKIQINPAAVTVRGSEAAVDVLDRLYTMPIDISGIMSTADVEVQLDLPEDITAPYLNIPAIATVYVEAYETKVFEVPASSIEIMDMNDEFIVTQNDISGVVKVSIRDIESVMKNIDESSISLSFDGSNLKPGIGSEVVVNAVPSTSVRSIEVDSSTVRIPVRLKSLINDLDETETPESSTNEPTSENSDDAVNTDNTSNPEANGNDNKDSDVIDDNAESESEGNLEE